MASYKYIARDLTGVRKEGLREAVSANDVLNWLREQGFTPVSVSEIMKGVEEKRRMRRRRRIKSADLAAFCWQLTTMIEGGISITTALDTIAEDIDNVYFQGVLQQIAEKIRKGETFSDSVAVFPGVFNKLSRSMILAGETSGTLAEVMHRLAEYYDNRDKLAKKVRGAMAYPCFVVGFIILIVVFIMAFIIPRFRMIFNQIGGQLPTFTRAFMAFYDALCSNLIYIIILVALIVVAATFLYKKTAKGHYFFSRTLLALPLLGKIFSQAFVATFCRTMSTLLASGVSVLEVFDILAEMTNNDIIRTAIVDSKEQIVGGSSVASSMASAGFFPNLVVKMTQVGEESGSLPKVLDKTANYYERKVDATITTVMSLLEPIMIVTIGAIVLVIVLALYLPIFTMSDIRR